MTLVPLRPSLKLVVTPDSRQVASRPHVAMAVMHNQRLMRRVCPILRAAGVDVITCQDLATARTLIDAAPVTLMVYDFDAGPAEVAERDAILLELSQRRGGPALILLSEQHEDAFLADIFTRPYSYNLIAKNGEIANDDLLVTIRKLLDRDIFGVEKYLRWGSTVHRVTVSHSSQRSFLLQRLTGFLDELSCREILVNRIVTVADEFLMNAIYDAPVDAAQQHPHAQLSRADPVDLGANEQAIFSYGSDGQSVVLGCRDPFGSLDPQQILRSLTRCFRKGADQVSFSAGGAGIGIYMVFRSVHQLIVNLHPGVATEFIAVLDIQAPGKSHQSSAGRSLNVFTLGQR